MFWKYNFPFIITYVINENSEIKTCRFKFNLFATKQTHLMAGAVYPKTSHLTGG